MGAGSRGALWRKTALRRGTIVKSSARTRPPTIFYFAGKTVRRFASCTLVPGRTWGSVRREYLRIYWE